eukprot:CAMPEP_0195079638 /NCGR_PEP_ID=MMETSP0448-20130528/21526_1 /TAXON_ID=66468 /ORGANISM="Heterocapsa triquestra, Strain CCMP 448" /LENGTH=51 /DNA_ID=CAMNT_0040112509 /DNA_START=1 /DNA_END=152 /DNA_ORIENTATION=-
MLLSSLFTLGLARAEVLTELLQWEPREESVHILLDGTGFSIILYLTSSSVL